MTAVLRLYWLYKDGVGVDVKFKHDVVVATEEANWESAHAICVQLYDVIYLDY